MTEERDRLEELPFDEFREYFDERYNVTEDGRSRYRDLPYRVAAAMQPILEESVHLRIAYESLVFIDADRGLGHLEMWDGVWLIVRRTCNLMERLEKIQQRIQEARRYTKGSERRRFYSELDEVIMKHWRFLQAFHSPLLGRVFGGDLDARASDDLERREDDRRDREREARRAGEDR